MHRWINVLSIIFYFVVVSRIAWMCYKKPEYNWDTLAYMAIVLDQEMDDVEAIHQVTYERAKDEMPPNKYAMLADEEDMFRKEMIYNPSKFFEFSFFFSH